jgi:hypothetical protein
MARALGELRGIDLAWPALLALQFGAGCSSSDGDGSGGAGGNPGAGSGGDAAASSVASVGASVSASASVVGPGAGGAGGSDTFVCDPPAEPGSIWEKTADMFGAVEPVPMCRYRGDVLLIFNGAAL